MSILYSEIFDEFNKCNTTEERQNILRKYGTERFKYFLTIMFSQYIKFDVIVPKYKESIVPAGLNDSYLDNEMTKIYRFIKDHPKRTSNITDKRKSQLLQIVLESLHKDEADLLVKLINKDLKIKWLTPKLLVDTFPDMRGNI